MHESTEKKSEPFIYPNIDEQFYEFSRVADKYNLDVFTLAELAKGGEMVSLSDEIIDNLENTDLHDIEFGNFEKVKDLAEQHNRDWEDLKDKMTLGKSVWAPIIMKIGDKYHKVSGNTRLMASKALGITPEVLLFEVEER